jgi:HupE / UreJ protein
MKPVRSTQWIRLAWLVVSAAVALCALMRPPLALAHPLSQGSLDIDRMPGRLQVRARVPVEEVFLASPAATLDEAWKEHGGYFLEHFRISADGQELSGRITGITEADPDHVVYDIDYPVRDDVRVLSLRQDLLNELSYAPGNPWEATFVVRVRDQGTLVHEGLLLLSKEPLAIASPDRPGMFAEYVRHGITHILGGYDHLLFVAALALGARSFRDLLLVIGMFTLAHSITLTLSVFDVVRLSGRIVEPMIAASIVFVAATNVFRPEHSRGRTRLAVAFFFGLFHGLGFAGGLLDAMSGMSGAAVGLAIVAFSLGVEIGHQVVVLPLFVGIRLVRAASTRHEIGALRTLRYGSALISVAGLFYLYSALRC